MDKWDILMIGTRVRIKTDKGPVDGVITKWLADNNKEITGYLVKPDNDPLAWITLNLEDKDITFEVIVE
jgi:hypothetical protein